MTKCHACGRRGTLRQPLRRIPGTALNQCAACDAAVPVPLAPAPHDTTEKATPKRRTP